MSTDQLTQCPSCPRRFFSKTCFNFHLETHLREPYREDLDLSRNGSRLPDLPNAQDLQTSLDSIGTGQEETVTDNPGTRALVETQVTDSGHSASQQDCEEEELLPSKNFMPEAGSSRHSEQSLGEVNFFKCYLCEKSFSKRYRLTDHIRGVHLKIFKCQKCEKRFGRKDRLKIHLQAIHDKTTLVECPICKERFHPASNMNRHIEIVHKKLRPFECQICEELFGHKTSLKSHVQKVHDKMERIKCQHCEKSCGRKQNLLRHVQAVHEKLRP